MADIKVLLVDDSVEFTDALSERMKQRGLDVTVANSGRDAIRLIESQTFDAIILDMIMPGMDGLETLRRLHSSNPDLQVVMLTGHADLKSGIEAVKSGAMDYLEKPADINQLLEKIKEAQANRVMLVEKRAQEQIEEILKKKSW